MMLRALKGYPNKYGFASFGIAIILVLLCALLAGCGSYTLGQGGQSQTTPTSTSGSTQSQQLQNCGKIDTNLTGKPLDAAQAKQAGNCFWHAYQHCQAASLLLKVHSLDTGADHTFTTKETNGKCSIIDTMTHYIVPNSLRTTRTYTCSGLVMQTDGLHFTACGSLGNILVQDH